LLLGPWPRGAPVQPGALGLTGNRCQSFPLLCDVGMADADVLGDGAVAQLAAGGSSQPLPWPDCGE
jgi:hypothetical protein